MHLVPGKSPEQKVRVKDVDQRCYQDDEEFIWDEFISTSENETSDYEPSNTEVSEGPKGLKCKMGIFLLGFHALGIGLRFMQDSHLESKFGLGNGNSTHLHGHGRYVTIDTDLIIN